MDSVFFVSSCSQDLPPFCPSGLVIISPLSERHPEVRPCGSATTLRATTEWLQERDMVSMWYLLEQSIPIKTTPRRRLRGVSLVCTCIDISHKSLHDLSLGIQTQQPWQTAAFHRLSWPPSTAIRILSTLTVRWSVPLALLCRTRQRVPFRMTFGIPINQGLNQSLVGSIVVSNLLEPAFSPRSNSLIYLNTATPGNAKRIICLWLDQANDDVGNFFQMSVLHYRYLREEDFDPNQDPNANTVGNEEMYSFWYNIHAHYFRAERNPITKEIAENWGRYN